LDCDGRLAVAQEETAKMKKALFLDRDGVVNEDYHYAHKPEHITFRDGIFDLCRAAIDKGYIIIVISNQAGVAKGKFSEEDVRALHRWMQEQFRSRSIEIAAFYYCPHHKDGIVERYRLDCECRKPRPGLILRAKKEFNVDIAKSLMIGDKESDRIDLQGLRTVIARSEYTGDKGFDVETLAGVLQYL
jgi:D-glycero-D-manno-heptose 1,7-bisphosphate phosphatase